MDSGKERKHDVFDEACIGLVYSFVLVHALLSVISLETQFVALVFR